MTIKAQKYNKIITAYGISTEDMEDVITAFSNAMKKLPPLGEDEINMIKSNPNLNFFDKWMLIRDIKKQIREMENKNDK